MNFFNYLGSQEGAKIQIILLLAIILILILIFIRREVYWHKRLRENSKQTLSKSRSVLRGQAAEQLFPLIPRSPFVSTDLRFIGAPIDYIAFVGLHQDAVEEVVFLEVKTGQSRLSAREQSLRQAIQAKKVRWEEWRL